MYEINKKYHVGRRMTWVIHNCYQCMAIWTFIAGAKMSGDVLLIEYIFFYGICACIIHNYVLHVLCVMHDIVVKST